MAQFTDSSNLATDNGDGKPSGGTLVAREADLINYSANGAGMLAPVWQEQSVGGVSMIKMMHSFRRRWLLALFVGLFLGGVAALSTWLIFPKQFEVDAMLQFRNMEEFLGDKGPVNPETNKQWRESQLVLIRSSLMLTYALREPKIANLSMIRAEDEPIYFLQKYISVYSPKDSDLAIIRMTGEDAREMVEIVRTLTEKYIDYAENEARDKRNKQLQLFDQEFNKNERDLMAKRQTYTVLLRDHGASKSEEVTTKKQQLVSEINFDQNRLIRLEQQLSEAGRELLREQERQKSFDNNEFPDALVLDTIKSDPEMWELKKDIAEVNKFYQSARSVAKYPDTDPTVRKYAGMLISMQEEADQLKAELRDAAIAKLKWGKDGPGVSIKVLQQEVDELSEQVIELKDTIKEKNNELSGLSIDSADLENQENEIKRLEEANAELSKRLTDAYLGINLPPPVHVIEPADEPEGSTLMYRVILTTFLGLLCFSVGLGSVVLLEYTKQRVSTLNEIGYGGLGIRVLGTVPNLARLSARSKNGDTNGTVSGILAESIDSVRTMLLSNKRADAPKVILVTSADEHEGKTTVASHLAASLARAGRRTLLVDGDLRKPAIHQLFDMPLSAGLCEVLRGEAEIDGVVHPAQVEGMWVMLAGQCDHRAVASLAKENAEAVFRTLRADYDFVVVDTGPCLAFADTMLMGSHADAAVMAILRDVSQIPKVYEARERLEAIGVPVLGGVVGGVSSCGSRSYAALS